MNVFVGPGPQRLPRFRNYGTASSVSVDILYTRRILAANMIVKRNVKAFARADSAWPDWGRFVVPVRQETGVRGAGFITTPIQRFVFQTEGAVVDAVATGESRPDGCRLRVSLTGMLCGPGRELTCIVGCDITKVL